MDSRQQFEEWMSSEYPNGSLTICALENGYIFCIGQYADIRVQDAWLGWQASRESMMVELPKMAGLDKLCKDMTMQEIREDNRFNRAIELSRIAIHSAGIRTK